MTFQLSLSFWNKLNERYHKIDIQINSKLRQYRTRIWFTYVYVYETTMSMSIFRTCRWFKVQEHLPCITKCDKWTFPNETDAFVTLRSLWKDLRSQMAVIFNEKVLWTNMIYEFLALCSAKSRKTCYFLDIDGQCY